MSYNFRKISMGVASGLLAACAGTQTPASPSALAGRPQQALGPQNQTDAMLRVGLPTAQSGTAADQVCVLIPADQQNVCPLQQTAVLGARQLRAPLDPKGFATTPAGAVVYMVAGPGLTPEWLGHLIECYHARTAENGTAEQARESCPLAEPDLSYSVMSTRNGFAVSMRSPHSEDAKRIFDVSERLAPSPAPHWSALAVRP